jgi:hypothetical protein
MRQSKFNLSAQGADMHTTPYRAPAKPVWPFLVPLSGRPKHEAESRRPVNEHAAEPVFDTGESDAATPATAKVVAFRFRTD